MTQHTKRRAGFNLSSCPSLTSFMPPHRLMGANYPALGNSNSQLGCIGHAFNFPVGVLDASHPPTLDASHPPTLIDARRYATLLMYRVLVVWLRIYTQGKNYFSQKFFKKMGIFWRRATKIPRMEASHD